MLHFLNACIQPNAVLMLFVAVVCLIGFGLPGFHARSTGGFFWLLYLFVGILAIISWVLLVFS